MESVAGVFQFSRASMTLDLLVVMMALALPVLAISIYSVRVKRRYRLHRTLQTSLSVVLLVVVLLFEIDMRTNGWQHLAEPSVYFESLVYPSLYVHLAFAVPTLLLWLGLMVMALSYFNGVGFPQDKVAIHRKLGRAAVLMMVGTTVTGWLFYVLAFVY